MTKKSQALLAREIALEAHEGQLRRDGVTPYFDHVERVANRLMAEGAAPEVVAAAWLHDVIEDGKETAGTLLEKGIKMPVVTAVIALTHTKNELYESYIRILASNAIARRVKFTDIIDNLNDSPTHHQIRKYAKALLILFPE